MGKLGVPGPAPRAAWVCGLGYALLLTVSPLSASAQEPIDDATVVERLFDVAIEPSASVDPSGRFLLLVHERKLLDLSRLAAPVISVAGRDINPSTFGPHAPLDYFGLTVIEIATGASAPLVLPPDVTIGFPAWAPDGSRFAFTVTTAKGTELWIGEPAQPQARKLVDNLNATLGSPCTWMPDSEQVLCRRIARRSSRNEPVLEQNESLGGARPSPGQPWIIDERAARRLLESRLELIDVASNRRREIGAPTAFEAVDPAPSSAFLLVTRVREPYPLVNGVDELKRDVEIWDETGQVIARLADGARTPHWHPSEPATLVWIEHVDGTDRIVLQNVPFTEPPREIHRTADRFAGLDWIDASDIVLVREYNSRERVTEVWRIDTAPSGSVPRLLVTRSVDSPFAELASPIIRTNRWGKPVVATDSDGFYTRGEEAAEDGVRTLLTHVDLGTGATERIWESSRPGYEEIVGVLTPSVGLLLTRYESATEPPNYFVAPRSSGVVRAVTNYQHPAPGLQQADRLRLTYARADGYELSSDLYLPPGVTDAARLPLVVWAYPRQVAPADGGGMRPSRERFFDTERILKRLFLLRGYAVLDNVAMPIVGLGSNANDTFVEQIIANAEAAVGAAADTGFVDPARVGVAGHSYGAFMAGNLLVHSHLFNAGIALSGAYNRTLTPFGFQTERRTFWEAPDTYLAMSPVLYSNQISAPLLLVHGLEDRNPGTSPLQSTQFYQAIRGNGGEAELLLLPLEGHSYRARESMLRTATAMLDWFDRYL